MNTQFCNQFLYKMSVSTNPDTKFIALNLISNALTCKLTVKKTLTEVSLMVVIYHNTKFLNFCS